MLEMADGRSEENLLCNSVVIGWPKEATWYVLESRTSRLHDLADRIKASMFLHALAKDSLGDVMSLTCGSLTEPQSARNVGQRHRPLYLRKKRYIPKGGVEDLHMHGDVNGKSSARFCAETNPVQILFAGGPQ
jgi:HAMP domain-containing protein